MNAIRQIAVLTACSLAAIRPGSSQQVTGQDLDKVLERADQILDEAKAAYEEARTKASVSAYIDAGFKLEDARIKYIVLQEIGSADKQKIAADRLRSVNQLSKLIHDGKVAISGTSGESSGAKPVDAPNSALRDPVQNLPPTTMKELDVTKRFPIPDAAKQRDADKLIKDVFKEQYAKKTTADRKALARLLLTNATKSQDDIPSMWVLLQESQDLAVQVCDIKTAMESIDWVARYFDVDAMARKHAALISASKTAKAPEEFQALAERLLGLIEELFRSDQYEPAEKAATLALQHAKKASNVALFMQATNRSKDVAEAKARYQSMKGGLETLAKNPEDPGANLEMGKFLCFFKGSWDLGLRFLAKGSDVTLKSLADKELLLPTQTADQLALADGWFDLAEKEKNSLIKTQLQAHARAYYEATLAGSAGLTRAKIEKRLEGLTPPSTAGSAQPSVDLLKLIDIKRDVVSGDWSADGKTLLCTRILHGSRVQLPYEPPDEYDLTIVTERKEGNAPIFIGLAHGTTQFIIAIDDWGGTVTGLGNIDGRNLKDGGTAVTGRLLTNDKPVTIVCSLRKTEISMSIDGKKILTFNAGYERLSNQPNLVVPNRRALFVGCGVSRFSITKMTATTISGQGKIVK